MGKAVMGRLIHQIALSAVALHIVGGCCWHHHHEVARVDGQQAVECAGGHDHAGRQGRQPNRCCRTQAGTRSCWSLIFAKNLTIFEVSSTDHAQANRGHVHASCQHESHGCLPPDGQPPCQEPTCDNPTCNFVPTDSQRSVAPLLERLAWSASPTIDTVELSDCNTAVRLSTHPPDRSTAVPLSLLNQVLLL